MKGGQWTIPDDPEIEEIRVQEEQRGKKHPQNVSELRRPMLLRKKFKEALEKNDEAGFIEVIVNDLGQLPASPEYEKSCKIWREFRGRR